VIVQLLPGGWLDLQGGPEGRQGRGSAENWGNEFYIMMAVVVLERGSSSFFAGQWFSGRLPCVAQEVGAALCSPGGGCCPV